MHREEDIRISRSYRLTFCDDDLRVVGPHCVPPEEPPVTPFREYALQALRFEGPGSRKRGVGGVSEKWEHDA